MDTKSKSSKGGVAVTVIVAALLSGLLPVISSLAYQNVVGGGSLFEQTSFVYNMVQGSYASYWKMKQNENPSVNPADLFFPVLAELEAEAGKASSFPSVPEDSGGGSIAGEDDSPDKADYPAEPPDNSAITLEMIEEFRANMLRQMNEWYATQSDQWENAYCMALLRPEDVTMGTASDDLLGIATGSLSGEETGNAQQKYLYYSVLRFSEDGSIHVPDAFGTNRNDIQLQLVDARSVMEQYFLNTFGTNELTLTLDGYVSPPSNFEMVFAIPRNPTGYSPVYDRYIQYNIQNYSCVFDFCYLVAILISCTCGVFMLYSKRWNLDNLRITQMPFELSAGILLGACVLCSPALHLLPLWELSSGYNTGIFLWLFMYAMMFIAIFFSTYAVMSMWKIIKMKPRRYFSERSLLVRAGRHIKRWAQRFWHWLLHVDLTDNTNRSLIKLLVANFIILSLISTIWVAGIVAAAVYSVVLFLLLQKYIKKLKEQYSALLGATRQMAEGKLDIKIEEDLGIFEPLKEELQKVQDGFGKAVDAEIKSQNMKTELITNVSHDLKTPLTAIITYIGLLKKDGIAEEDRAAYIQTLDLKSQRLKHLLKTCSR